MEKYQWETWKTEQWNLQTSTTAYTQEGYQFRIKNPDGKGYYLLPNRGQFNDGSRGDNAYTYITLNHPDRDEGEKDLVSIAPCCNTDYKQGPEKFIEPNPESIENSSIVVWYVPQMKNDNRPGNEYCWAENVIEKGVAKSKIYPCMCGPKFVPIQ
jgi:hypothetical protein